jgi:hypothetical protein
MHSNRTRTPAAWPLPAILLLSAVSGTVTALTGEEHAALLGNEGPIRYDRDIRPILSEHCFTCHGPDGNKRQAKLRLDERESAVAERHGSAAIVPGDLEESELWYRVNSDDPNEHMPPPESNKKRLTAGERDLVRRWIEEGAAYEPHWAFVPPSRPAEPAVESESWCRNPVDRFVLAELEKRAIEPSPAADRETLLRRLFLDLTGLPPTPEEIDAYLADSRADAYERWVDKLLQEEPYRSRYAERMATPWLDASRYADTCGIHTDAGRQIWPWRDWVLRAYRENMPFDRFATEQLAGDLLPDATLDQKVASGFNRNHVTTDEGGAIAEEYLVEYAVDRTATTGAVFLGLTLGCARCHEHKFDPISQEEFYSLYAFFDSIEEPGLYSQLPDSKRAFEPFLTVPSAEQESQESVLRTELDAARAELDAPAPAEDAERAAYFAAARARAGLEWVPATIASARSTEGATLTVQPDASVLASGANPAQDEHEIVLQTDASGLRLLSLEALPDPSLPEGRIGRAFNGNAVLTGVEAEVVSRKDPSQRENVRFTWAWADHEQPDGDHRVVNVLDTSDDLGWAVDAHRVEGGRVALLAAERPFGFEGGNDITVRLQYRSIYAEHTLGRVRLALGRLEDSGLALLPSAVSGWYVTGPFPTASGDASYDQAFGPEADAVLDLAKTFGTDQRWRFDQNRLDGELENFDDGTYALYLARRLFSPSARAVEVSVGSDDGLRLFLDGKEVFSKRIDRALAADQDRVKVDLPAGTSVLVAKVANTGGPGGFYYRASAGEEELAGDLVTTLLPETARSTELDARMRTAWRLARSPDYKRKVDHIGELETKLAAIEAAMPRTMVMKELAEPRETFLLMRGAYDKPDRSRPLTRGVPEALGHMPVGAPLDRRGLAAWLLAPENPLVARVAVNRLWEMLFETGLVRTSDDFGLRGEWPSHPELLDWLAVEFRESGWDVQHILRLCVTSSTYRQSSRVRPEVLEHDPDDRWLAYFPRRRLTAEEIRDQALYVSGLLVERLGGPSVKPYQPDGLWQEVAMPASNTRTFERGNGDELWRRSLYTYWKRACPPPALMTFDAPTREFCTIRRASTNTPLQAFVLWNDEQFVEAARVLASRTLHASGNERERLAAMYRRCTGRAASERDLESISGLLGRFRERFSAAPADAEALITVGEALPDPGVDAPELAAWTMVANAFFSLDVMITRG